MKKTIVALAAMMGVAMADSTPLTLPANTDYKWIAGSNANGIGTGATADIVKNLAAAITANNIGNTDLTGWFGGTGQAYAQNSYPNDIAITATNSFKFVCRPALSGEYVALGVALPEAAESITLSFSTTNKLGYSLWSYDGTTATELIGLTYQSASGDVSQTYNTSVVDASQLFVLWTANHPTGNAGGGQTVTVSNISLSYDAAPAVNPEQPSTSVPEPTTATLSLLALAGLAARRRRR